jgi:nitrogen fixation protein NifU and related proteins
VTSGYTDDLLAEARRDHGHGTLVSPRLTTRRANPLCGDEIELDVDHDGTRVTAVAQRTRGCSFTRAAASLLARRVTGLTLSHAREVVTTLRRDLAGTAPLPADFASLAAVRMYPARTRCALLPFEALGSALAEA